MKEREARNKKILGLINVILIVYIFSLSIGYAFFHESLTINGVANVVGVYEGDSLPIELVVLDTDNNRYFIQTGDSQRHLDFKRETWNEDSYTIYYKKAFGMVSQGKRTQTFTIAFTNPTLLDFTNGKITTWEVQDDVLNSVEDLSGSLSTTTVSPGQRCEIQMTVTHTFAVITNRHKVGAHVTFDLQGKERNFYFYVQWDPNSAS